MNTMPINISGFFAIDSQTLGKRIAWIFAIPLGLSFLSYGVYLTMDVIRNRSQVPDGMWVLLFIMFFLVLPTLVVLTGLIRTFKKPGVYFTGIRTTDSGFETGSLTVNLASVEPKGTWRKLCSGRILAGDWKPERAIIADSLSVVVSLKKARDSSSWFFERFVIASEGKTLCQLDAGVGATNFVETGSNTLVTILNGNFQILADKKSFLLPLERVADVLLTSVPTNPPSCTLNLVAGTNILTPSLMTFGAAGGLISTGIDSLSKHELEKNFKRDRLFDADFTRKLSDFLNRHSWTITINGKMISGEKSL